MVRDVTKHKASNKNVYFRIDKNAKIWYNQAIVIQERRLAACREDGRARTA